LLALLDIYIFDHILANSQIDKFDKTVVLFIGENRF